MIPIELAHAREQIQAAWTAHTKSIADNAPADVIATNAAAAHIWQDVAQNWYDRWEALGMPDVPSIVEAEKKGLNHGKII